MVIDLAPAQTLACGTRKLGRDKLWTGSRNSSRPCFSPLFSAQPEIPLAFGVMVKTVSPTSLSPTASTMPEALTISRPPLVNAGLPARMRLTMSTCGV